MIKTKIYDYDNRAKEIELRDDLKRLVVQVITGDEVIWAYYKDGTTESFDSSDCRTDDFDDGLYIVDIDKLDAWLNSMQMTIGSKATSLNETLYHTKGWRSSYETTVNIMSLQRLH